SKLLLADPAHPGGAPSLAVTIGAGSSSSPPFSLIGLSASGTVTLNAAADGLSPTNVAVMLEPAGFVFGTVPSSPAVNSGIYVPIQVYALNPQTLAPEANLALRPGIASIPVVVGSSNAAVLPNPGTVFFRADDSQNSASAVAAGSGTT